VEDWYHPEYVRDKAPKNKEERVTQGLNRILRLLVGKNINASFFIVGELAEKHPEIMERIMEAGHEIGFHGYYHEPLWSLTADEFFNEIARFDSVIRSTTKGKCLGYRAPSYSMDNRTSWALDILEEAGYLYDASVFPVKTPLYGVSSAPTTPYHPSSKNISERDESRRIVEFPALVYKFMGVRIPAAGGFYLRLLPSFMLRRAIRKMNELGFPAVLSVHTWEVDSKTPRLRLGLAKSFITYYNLNATYKKLKSLLSSFPFGSFRDYL
jgi:polysaccharide deacetylase family protein (PEP-CTERM system associated)